MLVLSRKQGEIIDIGDDVSIVIVRVKGTVVRIGIEAPGDVSIVRRELQDGGGGHPSGPPAQVPQSPFNVINEEGEQVPSEAR